MTLPVFEPLINVTTSTSGAPVTALGQGLGQVLAPGLGQGLGLEVAQKLSSPLSSSEYDYQPQPHSQLEPQNMKISGDVDRSIYYGTSTAAYASSSSGSNSGSSGGGSGGVKEGGGGRMSLLVPVSFEPLGHVKTPKQGLAPELATAPGPGLALDDHLLTTPPFATTSQITTTTTTNNNNNNNNNDSTSVFTSQPTSTPAPAPVPAPSPLSDSADRYPFGQFNQAQDTHLFSTNNNQSPSSQPQQQGTKSIFR